MMNKERDVSKEESQEPGIETPQTFIIGAGRSCGCAFVLVFQFHRREADSRHNLVYFRKGDLSNRSTAGASFTLWKVQMGPREHEQMQTCSQAHTHMHTQKRHKRHSWETVGTRILVVVREPKKTPPPLTTSVSTT